MTECVVGPPLPDLRTIVVDLVLRLRMKRGGGSGPVTADGLRRSAAQFERASGGVRVPPFVTIEAERIGSLEAEWLSVGKSSEGVVLYFHGGGFFMCSPRTHRATTWRLARATGRRVLAVAYRKAPDHAFPAWVDDGAAAFRWLLDAGHRPADIVLAGDSAGGNIALAVTHRLRRDGAPLPAGLILFSPWADLGCAGPSYRNNARRESMFKADATRALGEYLTRACDPRDPEASPVHADLTGFPRMLLFASSSEIFLDDARTIARRAHRAGVAAELHVYRNMPHAFPVLAGFLPRAKPAFDTVARFVQ
jgi:monoterpene epsilon-lactone hydrolase